MEYTKSILAYERFGAWSISGAVFLEHTSV